MADRRLDLAVRLRPYRVLLASRARAQMQYRASFVTDILGTVGVGLAEFAEVWVIFHNVDVLGGLDFTAALLVFALSNLAFSLADMFVGHLDQLPRYIRAGQVDAFYVRPLPLLAQLMTSDLSLRRVGRLSVALVALAIALTTADITWSAATVALILLTVVSGTAIFSALFTAAGGLQFFLVDGAEFTNAFTYGGQYAAQQSQQVFPDPLRIFWTFVIPTAFVAYLPAVAILDLPGDHLAPPWLAWFTPLAAALAWGLAGLCWRSGTRHYQGAGG
ncbi:ABC-2 type transport system permease protein [Humibacillus xanthopallidus]|uniref:ABC-2 type transport system permease protein n=1 Tax=Humibacillus xanthopallidus TaxID=412689 RepID=A0A543PMS9_9MICO|nr:ABC-2 family transporter protein [Humibacillus xanthopallidus]TQN45392.1 ABC-2 type transport system permease protein [Humibacillus xanthopallidus]